MITGISARDTVVAVGIHLHVELDASLNQCFTVLGAVLVVNVVVGRTMYQQQVAVQLRSAENGRTGVVAFTVFFRGTHEAFGIDLS